MKRTNIDGISGVFFSDEEFEKIQQKIEAQRDLVNELRRSVNNG